MLANSAFGTVTGGLILPRNAPVGKGAETKRVYARDEKTLERSRVEDKTIAYTYRKQDC